MKDGRRRFTGGQTKSSSIECSDAVQVARYYSMSYICITLVFRSSVGTSSGTISLSYWAG